MGETLGMLKLEEKKERERDRKERMKAIDEWNREKKQVSNSTMSCLNKVSKVCVELFLYIAAAEKTIDDGKGSRIRRRYWIFGGGNRTTIPAVVYSDYVNLALDNNAINNNIAPPRHRQLCRGRACYAKPNVIVK